MRKGESVSSVEQGGEVSELPESDTQESFVKFQAELRERQPLDYKEAMFFAEKTLAETGKPASRALISLAEAVGDNRFPETEIKKAISNARQATEHAALDDKNRFNVELAHTVLVARQGQDLRRTFKAGLENMLEHFQSGALDSGSFEHVHLMQDLLGEALEQGAVNEAVDAIRKFGQGRVRYDLYNYVAQSLPEGHDQAVRHLLSALEEDVKADTTTDQAEGYAALAFARLQTQKKVLPVRDALLGIRNNDKTLMEAVGWAVADARYDYLPGEIEKYGSYFIPLVQAAESIAEKKVSGKSVRDIDGNRCRIASAWLNLGMVQRAEQVQSRITDEFWKQAGVEDMAVYYASQGSPEGIMKIMEQFPEKRAPKHINTDMQIAYAKLLKQQGRDYTRVIEQLLLDVVKDEDAESGAESLERETRRLSHDGLLEGRALADALEYAVDELYQHKAADPDRTALDLLWMLELGVSKQVALPQTLERIRALLDSGEVSFEQRANILARLATQNLEPHKLTVKQVA